jgi:hypothetical protein
MPDQVHPPNIEPWLAAMVPRLTALMGKFGYERSGICHRLSANSCCPAMAKKTAKPWRRMYRGWLAKPTAPKPFESPQLPVLPEVEGPTGSLLEWTSLTCGT